MNPIVNYYDDLATNYDENRFGNSYGQFIDRQERQILNRLLKDNEGRILDMACGSGRLLNYATCGVDASNEMVQVAKKKFPAKEILLSDAENLPFPDHSIDTIISFHFFMHLDAEKIQTILKECHRVLKPGGRIIFDIPSKKRRQMLKYKASGWHGATSFTLAELERMNAGLYVQRRSYGIMVFPIHRFPAGIRKLFGKLDSFIANWFLKEYSSYLIVECVKK